MIQISDTAVNICVNVYAFVQLLMRRLRPGLDNSYSVHNREPNRSSCSKVLHVDIYLAGEARLIQAALIIAGSGHSESESACH